MTKNIEAGQNLKNPVMSVRHADLERISDQEVFKSFCPVCDQGVVLVARDMKNGCLSRYEHCTLCGQHFFYTDDNIGIEGFGEEKLIHTKIS